MPANKPNHTTLSIPNVPPEWVEKLHARLKQVCLERNWPKTTLAAYIRWLIEQDLQKADIIPPSESMRKVQRKT